MELVCQQNYLNSIGILSSYVSLGTLKSVESPGYGWLRNFMASNKLAGGVSPRTNGSSAEFWRQLEQDFPFKGVDEEKLRQQTEQWITCASELLGQPPVRAKRGRKS